MNSKDNAPMEPDDTSFDFDWDLIRSFLAVIDNGSLLAASRERGSTQPTIGRHIEMLEKQLGKVLFERTGRGLTPTDDARLIATDARRMRADADALARIVAGSAQARGGLVRIAASRIIATHVLPDIIGQLQRLHPHIDIAVVASDETSNLLRREADIALRHMRPEQASLVARKIGESRIRPCASALYLERHGTPKNPEELLHHRLIGADHDQTFLDSIEQLAIAYDVDINSVRMAVRSDDFSTRFAAVRAHLGIGFSPSHAIDRFEDIVNVPIDLPIPNLPLWLVVHREVRTTPRIRAVYDALATLLGDTL